MRVLAFISILIFRFSVRNVACEKSNLDQQNLPSSETMIVILVRRSLPKILKENPRVGVYIGPWVLNLARHQEDGGAPEGTAGGCWSANSLCQV